MDQQFPDVVEVVVEIPRHSRNKYEYDERTGDIRLNRVLNSAVFYNFDYGFIEGTRAGDGDHTDAILLVDEPTFPGCHVYARPIGGLEMRDENGYDFKAVVIATGDPTFRHIGGIDQVPQQRLDEIVNFFETYKLLEDKAVEVSGWCDREKALGQLHADREVYEREEAAAGAGGGRLRDRPRR